MSNQQAMFQQNPGAVLGSSWGNLNGNQPQQQPPPQQQQSHPPSMSNDDDDDMSDYYSDESDEEDAPLQISSWGEQTTQQDGTTEYNVSAEGWAALIDPNFKMGPGGLGSGNLHRKGGNYKPVDEEYILNHRLKKGSPMPKSAGSSPSRGKKKKPKSGAGRGRGAPSRPTPKPTPPPSRSYTRAPPTNNAWGSAPLADKPFWEQAASATPPPPPSNFPSGASASKYATGSNASRYAPQQPQQQWGQQPQQPQQQQWGQQPQQQPQQQQWGQQPQQQQWGQQQPQQQWGQQPQQPAPQQPTPQQPPAAQQQWNAGSAASKYAPQQGSSASIYATGSSASKYATDTVMSEGSGASKWASGSAASKYAPAPMSTSSSADSIYASPEAKKQAHAGPNILSINISFLPGVYATLNVPRQDNIDFVQLVEKFAADHHLTMEENAKAAFANNIGQLVQLELAKHR